MTRRRYELTDHEWSIISPLLPNKSRGVARVDDRRVLNGILWRFRTGSTWQKFQSVMARRPPAIIALPVGASLASGIGFFNLFQKLMMATSS